MVALDGLGEFCRFLRPVLFLWFYEGFEDFFVGFLEFFLWIFMWVFCAFVWLAFCPSVSGLALA